MAVVSSSTATSSAVRALALELKNLIDDPLEGIRSRLVNEENLFEWEVALFGPPETLYEGGYFKVINIQCLTPLEGRTG
jgi:ubiquitin-conjugating enzyme E2 R